MARSTATASSGRPPNSLPATLGELRASGWRPRTVKEELRANLVAGLAAGERRVPGHRRLRGDRHPGHRERASSPARTSCSWASAGRRRRASRGSWSTCSTSALPVVRGGELNDDPFAPISPSARALVAEGGDETPIEWLPRDRRYAEKLATPDITIADLIGEIDPIRVAEGRYLSDELTLHYGLIPRANRGIFALNELPDLAERIQVGLLNILEERDVQIRGFTIRLPLDLFVVASRQPRGLHQPRPHHHAAQGPPRLADPDALPAVARARDGDHAPGEARVPASGPASRRWWCRAFMEELVAELTHLARRSPDISQRSGVSVRVSVANMEVLEAAAIKRAVRLGEPVAAPRISDLGAVLASTAGKIEVEGIGEDTPEERIVERLVTKAVFATFNRHLRVDDLEPVVEAFEDGLVVQTGDRVPARDYVRAEREVPGLRAAVRRLRAYDAADGAEEPALAAAAVELVLEGLHLHRRLNKDRGAAGVSYRR